MPNVKTHDKLILRFLPVIIALLVFLGITFPVNLSIFVFITIGLYLFGGYYFSPDLDIDSAIYYRWKFFRWIWKPYRLIITHRSIFSHGLIIGTIIRIIYLFLIITIFLFLIITIFVFLSEKTLSLININTFNMAVKDYSNYIINKIIMYKYYFIGSYIALEFSAEVHIFSDRLSTGYKRMKTKIKKRKIF